MFNTIKYKKLANMQLKGQRKSLVLITLVSMLLIMAITGFNPLSTITTLESTETYAQAYSFENISYKNSISYHMPMAVFLIAVAVAGILFIANANVYLSIFLSKESVDSERISFNTFLKGLNDWKRGVLSAFILLLYLLSWFLLLIFSFFIKFYAYSQVYFILAEYKHISIFKAIKLSSIITQNHKAEIFIMHLSFLGWFILSCCSFGIGFLWTIPYMGMTACNAYKALKNTALEQHILTEQDFI